MQYTVILNLKIYTVNIYKLINKTKKREEIRYKIKRIYNKIKKDDIKQSGGKKMAFKRWTREGAQIYITKQMHCILCKSAYLVLQFCVIIPLILSSKTNNNYICIS